MTIQEMKAFCVENDITVEGNKRLKQTWETAIENWKSLQVQATAIKEETIATANEATEVSEKASVLVESFVVEVAKALTSEQAIGFYRSVLRIVMLAIVFAVMVCIKIGKWCWEHRSDTAVYHWVQDVRSSKVFWKARTEVLITKWILDRKVEVITQWADRLLQDGRDRLSTGSDRALVRLGLGGGSINV